MTKDTGLGTLTHILGLFTGFIGPLIIYLAVDDEFAKENAANALNWQIVFTAGMFASTLLSIVLIGLLLIPVLLLLNLAFSIMAAVKANDGEAWKYPLSPELV